MVRHFLSWRIVVLCCLAVLALGNSAPLQAQGRYSPQQLQALRYQQALRQQLFYQQLLLQQQLRQQALLQQRIELRMLRQQQLLVQQQEIQPVVIPVEVAVVATASTWVGSEDLQGYGRLELRFGPNGQATMTDADGLHEGTYTILGNSVTLRFYGGSVVYAGTINGETLAGTARNAKRSWKFTVSQ